MCPYQLNVNLRCTGTHLRLPLLREIKQVFSSFKDVGHKDLFQFFFCRLLIFTASLINLNIFSFEVRLNYVKLAFMYTVYIHMV